MIYFLGNVELWKYFIEKKYYDVWDNFEIILENELEENLIRGGKYS